MTVSELVDVLEDVAPVVNAEPWDNVGLLVGDRSGGVRGVLLAIDLTLEVLGEAVAEGCDFVVAYHPVIFEGLKKVVAPSVVFEAVRRGIAVYSPHTALDVAEGGTNDMLADALGLVERAPLRLVETKAATCKLVVFVPKEAVEKVSAAMFEAGAGRIGDYSRCSFRSAGEGTFFGEEGTDPAVGEKGKLERVEELRIETILPLGKVEAVVKALRGAHPYEEPAFDLMQLAAPPEGLGQGRIGELEEAVSREELIGRVKRELGLEKVLVAGPVTGKVRKVACLAGAGREHLKDALEQGAEVYLTGEIPHHDALRAAAKGCTVIATLHSNSERGVLKRLSHRLRQRLPELAVVVSKKDRDPFAVV